MERGTLIHQIDMSLSRCGFTPERLGNLNLVLIIPI